MEVNIICFECKKAKNIRLVSYPPDEHCMEMQEFIESAKPGHFESCVCEEYGFPCTKCPDFEPVEA